MFPMDQAINPSDDAVQIDEDDDVVPHGMRVFLKAPIKIPVHWSAQPLDPKLTHDRPNDLDGRPVNYVNMRFL